MPLSSLRVAGVPAACHCIPWLSSRTRASCPVKCFAAAALPKCFVESNAKASAHKPSFSMAGAVSLYVLCHNLLYATILYYDILDYTRLDYDILYYDILYYAILYCNIGRCSFLGPQRAVVLVGPGQPEHLVRGSSSPEVFYMEVLVLFIVIFCVFSVCSF